MVRWEPDARERLREAALQLYATKGFDDTTVAEIAQAVGLTERTFFRYFTDKREVLFAQTDLLGEAMAAGVSEAGPDARPLDIVADAVMRSATLFADDRLPWSRRRQGVILANPELMERELRKMGSLAALVAGALRARGVAEPAATLAAESGILVFRLAFEQWVAEANTSSLVEIERGMFDELRALA